VLRVHWLGKRELAVDGGAFYFNRVWDLPEIRQLESLTLDNLATAPWRLQENAEELENPQAGALRPLFNNVIFEESYFEVRADADNSIQLAFAIRLDQQSSGGWKTNLTLVVESLTGLSPSTGRDGRPGWSLIDPQAPRRIEFAQVGDWTVLGLATASDNEAMDALISHVEQSEDPFGTRQTNLWLQVDTDLNWLFAALGLTEERNNTLPKLNAVVSGDGGYALTKCLLNFPKPFGATLAPWTIPDQVIQEPLSGFMAVRGVAGLVTRLPGWSELPLGEVPDQIFGWSQPDNAFHRYLAVAADDSSSRMERLTDHLLNQVNPWLQANGPEVSGQPCPLFQRSSPGTGVVWGQMQGLQPFVQAIPGDQTDFLVAGLLPPSAGAGKTGLPPQLRDMLLTKQDLVYFGWENTAAKLETWSPVLQTTRAVTGYAPLPEQSAAQALLGILQGRVSETVTTAVRTSPQQIAVYRRSTLGLNAAELHLVADWLESATFPLNLHTFSGESQRNAE
jgi:hypothetical protein